ncbi:O-antigen ligase family protein [Rhodococcus sp. CH91]|uniref:O-antigen ligase family protein n=1 Tax=Rhodococcus sp. CH91 TaxID=2910256 RepID=UPI001F4A87BC|nr:O-antigen ligase family protein [Rhodococcus sp. CH91]
MTPFLLLLAVPAALALFAALHRRPQRGLLLVAALTPLHGLLVIVPGGEALSPWKEGVLLLTLAATFVSPYRDRLPAPSYPWWPAVVAWAAIGVGSAAVTSGLAGITAVKITFFYLVIPVILWRAPFGARDRDHLVTILMGTGVLTALIGLAQQAIGGERLAELGYRWDEHLRITGGILRSFSTFTTPFAFGLFVMISLIVGCAVAFADPRRLRNTLFLCAVPIMLLGMGVTIVRASYIGLVVALLWLAIHRYRALFLGFGAALALAPVLLLTIPSSVLAPLFSSSSLGERGDGWSQTLSSLWVHPFGQGLGATGSAAAKAVDDGNPMLSELSLQAAVQFGFMPYQPDNYYMKLAVELGPIGLWLFVLVLVCAAVSTLRASRIMNGQDAALALGVSGTIVAAAVASTVATYLEIFPLDVYFWLLLGTVGCALTQHWSPRRSSVTASDSAPSHSDRPAAASRPMSANC